MKKLTEKKRKWIINQFRTGRSAASIARIQKISRQLVYKLAKNYKKEGKAAYKAKKAGRPRYRVNYYGFRSLLNQQGSCGPSH